PPEDEDVDEARRRLVTPRPSLPPSYHFTWFRPTPALSGRRSCYLRPQWARGFLMDTEPTTTGPALFGRLLWMMVGPITLALLALQIVQHRHGWLTPTSLVYILVLGGTLLGRCLEVRSG